MTRQDYNGNFQAEIKLYKKKTLMHFAIGISLINKNRIKISKQNEIIYKLYKQTCFDLAER